VDTKLYDSAKVSERRMSAKRDEVIDKLGDEKLRENDACKGARRRKKF